MSREEVIRRIVDRQAGKRSLLAESIQEREPELFQHFALASSNAGKTRSSHA